VIHTKPSILRLLGLSLGLVTAGLSSACDSAASPPPTEVREQAALTDPSSAAPLSIVTGYLKDFRAITALHGLELVRDHFVTRTGRTHLRLEQRIDGVRVVGAYVKATVDADGRLVHLIDRLAQVPSAALEVPSGSEQTALITALQNLGHTPPAALRELSRRENSVSFELDARFHEPAHVERVAYLDAQDRLHAGYLVETWTEAGNLLHHTIVDASGKVASVELRTNTDSYNVFVEDPGKGAQTVVQGPASGGLESPKGWLGTGTQKNIDITGNNVHAYLDANGDNRADTGGTTVTGGNFASAVDFKAQPSTTGNRAVAVQNLFYFNNQLHDILYRHGFTEAAGNFQTSNYSRGGSGNDAVLAEAQDGSGTDNANFSTPSDGRAPRMQMYLWSGPDPDSEVVVSSPASIAGTYKARASSFGGKLSSTGISGAIVLVNDGTGTTSDGCETISAKLTNKIALLDRGTCDFTTKVLNAQKAGATAAIVANQLGDDTFSMGGTNSSIKIPSVMIGLSDGQKLRSAASVSGTERKLAIAPIMRDGDLDSDVVFHEYGHGLSWRLVGSMSGMLAGAIGEGASDGLALLIDGDDKMGEYAGSSDKGIRRYPYAGYPLTYSDVTGAEVHDDGEIYAAIIWRLKELANAAGISDDQLLSYYVDGMNYTRSSPAYEDMRDGLVQATTAHGHQCLVWEAFAQFGVGVGAKGTISGSTVKITESFTLPASCQ
jgi:extracellular elastinolytic metalloproteinase